MSKMSILSGKYHLCEHQVDMLGKNLVISSVVGVDKLVDEAVTEDDLPFWADLWPSAIGLAQYLWAETLEGVQVLELGAGPGLPGIAAAIRGATVLQTDLRPEALELARHNAEQNNVAAICWEQADWRDFQINRVFPLIVGSDIAYEPVVHPCLVDVVCRCTAPQGRFVMADPGRAPALSLVDRFISLGWGWQVEEVQVPWETRNVVIHLHILTNPTTTR
jgi:predicted nicotinamide N-methyase